jgi:hypothetical protein
VVCVHCALNRQRRTSTHQHSAQLKKSIAAEKTCPEEKVSRNIGYNVVLLYNEHTHSKTPTTPSTANVRSRPIFCFNTVRLSCRRNHFVGGTQEEKKKRTASRDERGKVQKSHRKDLFSSVAVDTSGRVYDDFSRLLFLHAHREASALANEIPEESEKFRFLRAACYANIKGSVGLILANTSVMRISIPLDLSSRPFTPLPRFMRSRRAAPLLVTRVS